MDETGEQVAAEPLGDGELTRLVAEYYEALAGEIRKDRDGHWSIAERFS